ncbi:MAG: fasciclin domain-containing protein [Nitrososphaerales archaeon]
MATTTMNQQQISRNILDAVKSNVDFKTLVQAIEAAGLADTFRAEGPYTVFAPTDEAFRNLPTGTVERLMKDLPKLKSILSYHVINRKITSAEVHTMTLDGRTPSLTTLQGSPVMLKTNLTAQSWVDSKQTVYVNDAKVVRQEIEASNGIIHAIDRVLLPTS